MRLGHRSAHRRLWPILALVIGVGFALAFYLRPAPAGEISPASIEAAR